MTMVKPINHTIRNASGALSMKVNMVEDVLWSNEELSPRRGRLAHPTSFDLTGGDDGCGDDSSDGRGGEGAAGEVRGKVESARTVSARTVKVLAGG
eukprot:CAMPEP_0183377936 /NCGR_PEP_ID=MMETSP0164_2-20130417/124330_1 /TAXON_ID=221442 /ORGANISM="Coccolithus pelagicus ssp braarudi, Strain PLY182g" /LENGTH=95 /DNA_ID=CAMNT_0025555451 /DNA_START=532 /DNA_END=817 /DNA_ORIENTATION=+